MHRIIKMFYAFLALYLLDIIQKNTVYPIYLHLLDMDGVTDSEAAQFAFDNQQQPQQATRCNHNKCHCD